MDFYSTYTDVKLKGKFSIHERQLFFLYTKLREILDQSYSFFLFLAQHQETRNLNMDRIKEVQDDPAKRKQALKSMLCSDSLNLAVCIAMVVVGVQVGNIALAMFMTTM